MYKLQCLILITFKWILLVENKGLDVILAAQPDGYISYHRTFYGIQVALHSPDDFPVVYNPLIVQPNYDMSILVEPTVLLSDRQIKDLPVSRRKCAFLDEVRMPPWNWVQLEIETTIFWAWKLFDSFFASVSKTERITRVNGYKRHQNVHVQTLYDWLSCGKFC